MGGFFTLPSDAEREDMGAVRVFVEMQAALLDALRDGRGTFLCVSVKYTTTYFYMYMLHVRILVTGTSPSAKASARG